MIKITLAFRFILLILGFLVLSGGRIFSAEKPDTLKVTLQEAEALFLKNNFRLLASKYSIEASRAAIIQAKLWNNPNLSYEQNVVNQNTHKWFDITNTGNSGFQLSQLILLAGKRSKQVKIAETNSKITEIQFTDVLRSLKSELRKDFFDIYFLQKSLVFYNESINSVRKTVAATEESQKKRSLLLNDVVRLKALLFSLENEKLSLINQINDLELDLRVMVSDFNNKHIYFMPLIDDAKLKAMTVDNVELDSLINVGLETRSDFRLAQTNVTLEENNLSYQKALAIPDLSVGGSWSRAGSYIHNYFAINLAIDLPVFNRNQGNIQVSENNLQSNKLLVEQTKLVVESDIISAYNKAYESDKLFRSADTTFPEQYSELVKNMTLNYEQRNITTIEFTDFFESYRTSMVQINVLNSGRIDAFEALNFAVGTTIINPY